MKEIKMNNNIDDHPHIVETSIDQPGNQSSMNVSPIRSSTTEQLVKTQLFAHFSKTLFLVLVCFLLNRSYDSYNKNEWNEVIGMVNES